MIFIRLLAGLDDVKYILLISSIASGVYVYEKAKAGVHYTSSNTVAAPVASISLKDLPIKHHRVYHYPTKSYIPELISYPEVHMASTSSFIDTIMHHTYTNSYK